MQTSGKHTTILSLLLLIVLGAKAGEPWENNHILQQNRLAARACFIPYYDHSGDQQMTLNGTWKFRWTPTPEGRIADFWQKSFNDKKWDNFRVPANWEVNGYGTPIYASAGYTFRIDLPYVTTQPKDNYTAYKERNPVGQYRRTFSVPAAWLHEGRNILRFDGVMSAFKVWVNGVYVGYSQGSQEAAEFDVTSLVEKGENTIALEVYKYSDGAYLEDQDFWRFGGIQRDVTLFHTHDLRLRDVTIRTLALDDSFRNFRLQINPQLELNHSILKAIYEGKASSTDYDNATVKATLRDAAGNTVAEMDTKAETILDINHKAATMNEWFPQRGYMKFERMGCDVKDVNTWTAETPYLYTLTLLLCGANGAVIEQVQQKVGFRQLTIKEGRFLINGKQVRFRGVNRHEHDMQQAHVMTDEVMLRDLHLMKEANVNAIRLSHYPNAPRFYELCDSMGFYLIDEANSENHGVRGTLTSTPDWNDAMMDRAIRMAERDKNHPSIVMWSLGNESGYGANHASMAAWLHEFDPTRYIHYEGAQGYYGATSIKAKAGESLMPDPQYVDVISRFYPRVQEEYLNPGVAEDEERAENARWEFLKSIAERNVVFTEGIAAGKTDDRPVMTSEYAHCMGNALGNFREYWDEFYSNPRMLGGFIWDWVDQGILSEELRVKSEESHLNSSSNNKSNSHSSLSTLHSSLTGNARIKYGGDFGDKPNLKAFCLNGVIFSDRTTNSKFQEVKAVYSPVQFARHGNDIYVINRSSHLPLSAYSVTPAVFINGKMQNMRRGGNSIVLPEVAYGDSAVIAHVSDFKQKEGMDNRLMLTVKQNDSNSIVHTAQVSLSGNVLDYAKTYHSGSHAASHDAPLPEITNTFYRAATDNDTGFGNWLAKDWKRHNLDSAVVVRTTDDTEEYRFAEGKIIVKTVKEQLADGSWDILQTFRCEGTLPELPRLAMQLVLPDDYSNVEYYGKGPWDNYPDRAVSAITSLWSSTVADEYVHYPRPQDCGNHEQCSYVQLKTAKGKSITVTALDAPFAFSALPYTAQEIASVKHDYELPATDHTVLTLSCATLGLGNGSCGPGVLKRYSIDKSRTHTLHVRVAVR